MVFRPCSILNLLGVAALCWTKKYLHEHHIISFQPNFFQKIWLKRNDIDVHTGSFQDSLLDHVVVLAK
jgi:hypothetical protein